MKLRRIDDGSHFFAALRRRLSPAYLGTMYDFFLATVRAATTIAITAGIHDGHCRRRDYMHCTAMPAA